MPCISLGPIEFRMYSGQNWSNLELAFVTARGDKSSAQRETAIRGSFKSEHLIETLGEDDLHTAFTAPDGTVYPGRVVSGADDDQHVITGEQMYARKQRADFLRQSRRELDQLTAPATSNGSKPAPAVSA